MKVLSFCCLIATLAACAPNQNNNPTARVANVVENKTSEKMTDAKVTNENKIAREWVEIREESKDGSLVFRPADFPIPPARGRRHLKLTQLEKSTDEGTGEVLEAGPVDKLEATSFGSWKIDKKTLYVGISGWEGEYQIEKLQDDILVLQKLEITN